MEIFATTGTRFCPQPGHLAELNGSWREHARPKGAMPAAAGGRSAIALIECGGHHARFRTCLNLIVIDRPVTDRLRGSASEP